MALPGALILCASISSVADADESNLQAAKAGFEVELQTIHGGYDRKTCWVHPRAGMIPGDYGQTGDPFTVVLTMHELRISDSDCYYPIHDMRTDDGGKTWTGPTSQTAAFGRRPMPGRVEEAISDFWPTWHAKTEKLLGTGHTVRYRDDTLIPLPHPRATTYSVYDPRTRQWSPFQKLATPDDELFFMEGAGSTQRVDLENGDILLPSYTGLRETAKGRFSFQGIAFVMRCSFDGRTLKYIEHGDTLTLPTGRGFTEPSLVRFGEQYLMTLRNDEHNYVGVSKDGLHFGDVRRLKFDDGSNLGSYNTQTHWLTLGGRLYLVYTRRGADNDHIVRHRAPLFIAQFDPDRLRVIRNTERIAVPERGARLGNFGITMISDNESWITVAEWMQTTSPNPHDPTVCEKYGSDNSVYVAKIRSTR